VEFNKYNRKLFHALLYPFLFLFFIWVIKAIEFLSECNLHEYGVYPRQLNTLITGVFFMPLLHGDWQHLFSNSIAIGALGFMLVYFYRPLHFKIFFLIYFFSGIFTWFLGRPSYHIGASGIVYGLVSFLFVSGILRKHLGLMAVSAITVLSYGSIVWGVFPLVTHISWEGHLGGFITGIILAFLYKKSGPQKTEYIWKSKHVPDHDEWRLDYKEDNSLNTEEPNLNKMEHSKPEIRIIYTYKETPKD
jgi:membrane associated rhomboid family serine protease